ncbi:apolipoprotein N-acyltransferase [Corynebacterium flavescens]|uniref:Apolipoprotein N-acyltransferase n=2 Tax=Corynebacterium flavescens TaxID=28028 RepID=A0A1L7CLW8_CORFL|nr:apolipoprotein N-acyltransferase [Corynebacterium flavescens]APT86832.1 acyltransferase [Corynebacterium flavescens]KAA8722030.1 apolipoprotein N-acyltransferase [Corynebacterium flavescens]GEB97125.1 apolipoprotein N-acyltransferase [Corynebacterium flavescens]
MLISLGRLALALASGGITFASVKPLGWWPAGIVGIALLYVSFMPWRGRTIPTWYGAVFAFAHGLVLYLCTLPWIGELVGQFPYIALAFWLSLYSLLLGIGGVAISRWRWGFLVFPFFYVAVELLRSSVPFGGFSWVRLAWGQIDGPLAYLAPWGGPALITFATVACAMGLVGTFAANSWRLRGAGLAAVVLPLVAGLLAEGGVNNPAKTEREVTVAAIQGNVPRTGLDFEGQRRAVLSNHVMETQRAAREGAQVDLVLWPENSSDVNPFQDAQARTLVDAAANAIKAPILVGTLTEDAVGERNTMQVFYPDSRVGEHHYKKYLQPFGETMPMRDFFRHLSSYVDYAGDFKPGDGPGVVDMAGIAVGVATCYEVSFDEAFRSSVRHGAGILVSPTNNATFGYSDMTYQQLAMSRLRALETDRAVVVAATSGVSAIVQPDGSVSQQTEIFEPDHLIATLPVREGETFAVRFGSLLQWLMAIIGIVCAVIALRYNRLPRAPRKSKKTIEELSTP